MSERAIISHHRQEGVLVVTFELERMNEFAMADRLRAELHAALADAAFDRLVLDFEKVQYVISEIFCVLIGLSKEMKAQDRRIVACNLNPFLREICSTIRLDEKIPVYDSLDDAVKA